MINSLKNSGTEGIFNGENSKAARKIFPKSIWKAAARKLDQLDSIEFSNELGIPPANRLEVLKGDTLIKALAAGRS
ncbi:MAG: hypothetical protein R2880_06065 [Deinococcales bacterium]